MITPSNGEASCANDDTLVRHGARGGGGLGLARRWWSGVRPNTVIIMLIAGVAVFGTVVAALQIDANTRAARASRAAQAESLSALQTDVSGLFELSHDLGIVRSWWELGRLDMLALRRANTVAEGTQPDTYRAEAQRLAAAAEVLTGQSDVFEAPYYNAGSRLWPDLNRYWFEQVAAPRLLAGEQQAVQTEIGQAWGSKSNAYQTVITLVAVTLFLYGLALTVEGGLKWGFAVLGTANLSFIVLWTLLTMLRPVPQVAGDALQAYVDGYIDAANALQLEYQSLHAQVPERADSAITNLNRAIQLRPDYAAALTARGDAYTVKGEALLFSEGDAAVRDACFRSAVNDYQVALRLKPDDYHTYWNLGWVLYLLGDYEHAVDATEEAARLAPLKAFGARLVQANSLLGMGKREEGLAECRAAIEYAAAHPLSSDAYYFRQAIRNAERLQAVRPHEGLQEAALLLKESFVSLKFRGTPRPGTTRCELSNLSFGAPTVVRDGEPTHFWTSDRFPADTEQVNVMFDYQDMVSGELVVLKVYYNGVEQPFFNAALAWQDGAAGHSTRLAVQLPVERTLFGLSPGRYGVEIYVEGNLRAAGEFTIDAA